MSHLQEERSEHFHPEYIDSTDIFPTSFAQQRLWFLDQLLGASGLYNIPWVIQLNGELDASALQQSLEAIVARHEVLRTCFVELDGEPVQVISDLVDFACPLMDLSTLPLNSKDGKIQGLLDAESNKPFDIKLAPLVRATLFKLSEQEHILLVTFHHSVADGWSMGVFRRELASFYEAFSLNQSVANLPELPIQYADYAVWQREWLQGEVLEKQLSYWKNQLADLTVLELPTDKHRPMQLSYRGAQETFQLSAVLTQGLKTLSQQRNVTLFMTLLAAFQVLLHRYSGQEDIVVGTAIAGRNQRELENLIGFFVNTLVLRTDLSDTPSFDQLLSRVREVCLSAYAHQDLPFEKLVAELQVQRDMSRHPLFQVMLVLQPRQLQAMQLPGLTTSSRDVTNETAKFDLTLSLVEHSDGLTGTIEYSTDLFNVETITRLAGHFQTLLEAVIEQPETSIAQLPLLTAQERYQLLVKWNATQTDYPKDKCIHQLFEEQAARTPDAIALVFENQQLSYQALNAKANQLAHYLQTVGVKPDTLVAIFMERSFDMVIGLLAILKAGGAYVPLDSTYPRERLAFMLEDTKTQVLLTHFSLAGQLPIFSGLLVCLDTCWIDLIKESTANLPCHTLSNNLAYIMYTSGSTGAPKGVEICHYNIARLLFNNPYARFDNKQNFLLAAPIAFDASTFELWGGLLHGSRCIIYPDRVPTFNDLEKIIKEENVSILWLTASLFNAVIDEKPHLLGTVAQILTGGEALSTGHIQHALKLLPDSQIINGYGPTESTTFACCYPIPKTFASQAASIPIGRPIANTQIYLLDKHLQPVPIGVSGEIHIGGDGLARGYLNRPELTAEKFIADPFSDDSCSRLYKTGDLARYQPDGTIEFLGRIDHQVKLRGFRIELGEIEAVLETYPGINTAVATVREDLPGDKRLIAYLAHSQLEQSNIDALRLFLKEQLPDYMVPSAFVFLDELPLTPSGKLDRKALPAPDQTRSDFEQAYVAASSSIEEVLVTIWREVLNIDRIGVHDNFFELGGHSLLILVLCTKIEAKIGKSIPMSWVFQFPTISQLAVILKQDILVKDQKSDPIITAFQINSTLPPLFWGMSLGRDVSTKITNLNSNKSLFLLHHQSLDGNAAKHISIPDMASYYLQSILQINPDGPYYLGGFSIGGLIMYEIACQLCRQGKKVALLFLLDPSSLGGDENEEGCTTFAKACISFANERILFPLTVKLTVYLGEIPRRFHWRYISGIYTNAIRCYQPEHPLQGIENTIMVHTKNRKMQDWTGVFNGKIKTYSVDCNHHALLDDSHYNTIWLNILKQTLKE